MNDKKEIKREMEDLLRKMKKEYTTLGNTQKHQEMYKRYEVLEKELKR